MKACCCFTLSPSLGNRPFLFGRDLEVFPPARWTAAAGRVQAQSCCTGCPV